MLNALYKQPFIDAEGVRRACGLSMPSSCKLIAELEKLGILKEITGAQRKRMYLFERYLKLFQT